MGRNIQRIHSGRSAQTNWGENIKFDREEIESRLKKLPREKGVLFAWRCAVRALPFLGAQDNFDYWETDERQSIFYYILRALDTTAYAFNAVNAANAAVCVFRCDMTSEEPSDLRIRGKWQGMNTNVLRFFVNGIGRSRNSTTRNVLRKNRAPRTKGRKDTFYATLCEKEQHLNGWFW